MKTLLAFAVTLLLLSASAFAATGTITTILVPDGVADTRPCIFVVTSAASTTWYAVPIITSSATLTALSQMQFDRLHGAFLTGNPITYSIGSTVSSCSSYNQLYDITD